MKNIYFFDCEPAKNDFAFIDIEGNRVDFHKISQQDTVYCWDSTLDQNFLYEQGINLKLIDYQKIWMKNHNTRCRKRLTKTYRRYGFETTSKEYRSIQWHSAIGDAEVLRRIYILESEGAPLIYG